MVRAKTSIGTITATIYVRAYVRSSGGTYTQIGTTMSLAGQNITTTSTNFTFGGTSQPAANLNTGDKLYFDVWFNITANNTGSGSATTGIVEAMSATQGHANACQIVTPGYQAQSGSPVSVTRRAVGRAPVALHQDNFNRTNQAGIGTASDGHTYTDIGSQSAVSIAGNTYQCSNVNALVGSTHGTEVYDDVEARIDFQYTGTYGTFLLSLRQQSMNSADNGYRFQYSAGAISCGPVTGGAYSSLGSYSFATSAATWYSMRCRVVNATLFMRVWLTSGAEPSAWHIQATDTNATWGAGYVALATNPGGTSGRQMNYDNFLTLDVPSPRMPRLAGRLLLGALSNFQAAARALLSIPHARRGVGRARVVAGPNPYGMTRGLNPSLYPVTARLSQTIVTWAAAMGLDNFRIQLDAQWIWRNQGDAWTAWDWSPLDDAVWKLTQAGFKNIVFPLRGWPTWGLTNATYQATDEPQFMPDPTVVQTFGIGVASRYNGAYNIPGYGPMRVHTIEIGNEEYNVHFTPTNHVPPYVGMRTPPSALYDGHLGVTSTPPQPARDPWFLQQVLLGAADGIRAAAAPGTRIGAGAIWWYYTENFYDFIYYLGSAIGKVDFINFHFYSNAYDPTNPGQAHRPSIAQAISNMKAASQAAGYPGKAIRLTEEGYQSPTDCDEATAASRHYAILEACRLAGIEQVYFYTLDDDTGPTESSLIKWDAGTSTYRQLPAYTTWTNYIAAHATWPTSNRRAAGRANVQLASRIGRGMGRARLQILAVTRRGMARARMRIQPVRRALGRVSLSSGAHAWRGAGRFKVSSGSLGSVAAGQTIRAADINQLVTILQRPSGQKEAGGYSLLGASYTAGAAMGAYIGSVSRGSTPVSVAIDTSEQAASGCNAPSTDHLSASGFRVSTTGTGTSSSMSVGGAYTITY